ncbi:MAG: hypothetical protein JWM05_546 [Acidimicrobiales bacterium]|nr:hypothetical protein [Acidimicrobiales bacterium]
MTDFVVITGLSGAGRSSAADVLEDLGWFVIDNLPTALMAKVVELAQAPGSSIERVAFVLGAPTTPEGLGPSLAMLRTGGSRVRVLFLDASTDVLVRRYESTRRRHPHGSGERLVEAIEQERALLDPVRGQSDVLVDTSDLNVHQFRERITGLFSTEGEGEAMQTTILSFGFKHGLPVDVDLVIDCRFLPNPHWVDELRPLNGLDEPVREYVLGQDVTGEFLTRLEGLLELLLPAYEAEGKAYLSIAFGCTGGQHRSVTIAEEVAARLRIAGAKAKVTHRDIGKS